MIYIMYIYISKNKQILYIIMAISKEEQKMYPKVYTEINFKPYADTRNDIGKKYIIETTVNNENEESKFYDNLNHKSNIILTVKLPNGVIK